mgnify:CR=1 FL=1
MDGEIDQLAVVARPVEHLDRTDLRSLGHDERQAAVDRKRAVDAKHHDAGAAIVAGMQGDARADDGIADAALGLLRDLIFYLPIVLGVGIIIRLFMAWSHHGATYDARLVKRLLAGLTALILGPGILVNLILKEHSHRPRPRNTDLFGGDLSFVPAGDFSGACGSNCSFISGEAAGAGWLFCYAVFLVPDRFRLLVSPPLIALALASPAMRLAYGGHYLSDVILAWLGSVVVFTGTLYFFTRKETASIA